MYLTFHFVISKKTFSLTHSSFIFVWVIHFYYIINNLFLTRSDLYKMTLSVRLSVLKVGFPSAYRSSRSTWFKLYIIPRPTINKHSFIYLSLYLTNIIWIYIHIYEINICVYDAFLFYVQWIIHLHLHLDIVFITKLVNKKNPIIFAGLLEKFSG